MKILVINPCNWYNKGDVSNRLGLIVALKNAFGKDIDISLESTTPNHDGAFFANYKVRVISSIFEMHHAYVTRLFLAAKNALLLIVYLTLYRIGGTALIATGKEGVFVKEIANADLVISAPGGFLGVGNSLTGLLSEMFRILLSKILMKKPTIIYAQSLYPVSNRLARLMTRYVLNKLDIIILREEISKHILANMGVRRRVLVTADASFSLNPPPVDAKTVSLETPERKLDKPFVGVTVWGGYLESRKTMKKHQNYVKELAKGIDNLVRQLNATVFILPQTLIPQDIAAMRSVYELVKNKSAIRLVLEDYSPQDLMDITKRMDLFVATRLHSAIFALVVNVPTVVVAYEHKALGVMNMMSLGDWVLDIDDLNAEQFIAKANSLWRQRFSVKQVIMKQVEFMRCESLRSALILNEWYNTMLISSKRAQHTPSGSKPMARAV